MGAPEVVPASEFTRNFGRYRIRAQRSAIAVSSHGRATSSAHTNTRSLGAFGKTAGALQANSWLSSSDCFGLYWAGPEARPS
jgi:hypothetical protein